MINAYIYIYENIYVLKRKSQWNKWKRKLQFQKNEKEKHKLLKSSFRRGHSGTCNTAHDIYLSTELKNENCWPLFL